MTPSVQHAIPSAIPARRRRSNASDPLKKVTLRLHDSVATAIRALVDSGQAASADAFIEDAIVAQLRDRRRQRVYEAYAEAAADATFMHEMAQTNRAFDGTAGDGLTDATR